MDWVIENWYLVIVLVAAVFAVGFTVYKFLGLPTKEQVAKIKEWLLLAVTEAEIELGSGTGQMKLRSVYDKFITKFPMTAKLISFETFSKWVDDALDSMKNLIATNEDIKTMVMK